MTTLFSEHENHEIMPFSGIATPVEMISPHVKLNSERGIWCCSSLSLQNRRWIHRRDIDIVQLVGVASSPHSSKFLHSVQRHRAVFTPPTQRYSQHRVYESVGS